MGKPKRKKVYNKEIETRLAEINAEIKAIRENRKTIPGHKGSDPKTEGIIRLIDLQEEQLFFAKLSVVLISSINIKFVVKGDKKMDQQELKRCPFCGSEAVINYVEPHKHSIATFMPDYEGGHFIECTGCTAAIAGGPDRQEAIAAWNRRVNEA
jgi:Lar family restriction alleviation protein